MYISCVLSYITAKIQARTGVIHDLLQSVAVVEHYRIVSDVLVCRARCKATALEGCSNAPVVLRHSMFRRNQSRHDKHWAFSAYL